MKTWINMGTSDSLLQQQILHISNNDTFLYSLWR